jgi:hypothetical protein
MPYWDWARGSDGGSVPDFFLKEKIEVTRPSGEQQTIWNPLYAFYFHPLVPEDFDSKVRVLSPCSTPLTSTAVDDSEYHTAMALIRCARFDIQPDSDGKNIRGTKACTPRPR